MCLWATVSFSDQCPAFYFVLFPGVVAVELVVIVVVVVVVAVPFPLEFAI